MCIYLEVCRICLCKRPDKDIFQSKANKSTGGETYADIMMICLNIEVEQDSKISTKLCIKCMKKLISFHKFKSLALQTDIYLRSLIEVKDESSPVEPDISIKSEQMSLEENSQDGVQMKDEIMSLNLEDSQSNLDSDDQVLSAIKGIEYEYVEYNTELDAPTSKSKNKTSKNLRRKLAKVNSNKNGNLKQICEECGKTVIDLKSHSYSHKSLTERKRYKCHHCDKMFTSQSSRCKHNKIKHLGIKKICEICNKAVTQLKHHRLIAHNREALPLECIECGHRTLNKSLMDLHMRQHTKDRPFVCDICDKKFISNALLQNHKRSVHNKEKSHMCQLCSKSFFKKYHLQLHLKTHSEEKSYKCPDCGKHYKTAENVKRHQETHLKVKNFDCKLCTQRFINRKYLTAHMISHTKVKRYPCRYCDVKFHRSDHRKRHEYTAHQKNLITISTGSP